jgi:hypothetical protein
MLHGEGGMAALFTTGMRIISITTHESKTVIDPTDSPLENTK